MKTAFVNSAFFVIVNLLTLNCKPPPILRYSEVIMPLTCYYINRTSMLEIDSVCQHGKEDDYLFCIQWTYHLDYDTCDDYDILWMEELHEWEVSDRIFDIMDLD